MIHKLPPDQADQSSSPSPICLQAILSGPHTTIPMSQTCSSSMSLSDSNYQLIFSAALQSYEIKTGNDLRSNPLLPRLKACNSPNAIIALLQVQIHGPDQSRRDTNSEKMSNWLNPTVKVIAAFSDAMGNMVSNVGLRVFHLTYPASGC